MPGEREQVMVRRDAPPMRPWSIAFSSPSHFVASIRPYLAAFLLVLLSRFREVELVIDENDRLQEVALSRPGTSSSHGLRLFWDGKEKGASL